MAAPLRGACLDPVRCRTVPCAVAPSRALSPRPVRCRTVPCAVAHGYKRMSATRSYL